MERVEPGSEAGGSAGRTPPTVPGSLGSTPPAWPSVLGVTSVLLGSLGIVKNACTGISGIAEGVFGTNLMGYTSTTGSVGSRVGTLLAAGLGLVSLGVSVWLLVAGIKLLKRKADGARLHRGWAWTRIVVVIVEVGIGGVVQLVMVMQSSGAGATAVSFAALTLVVMLAFGLTYPIVVLWVLSRPHARREIGRWSGSCARCGYDLRGLAEGAPCPECSAGRGGAGASHAGG